MTKIKLALAAAVLAGISSSAFAFGDIGDNKEFYVQPAGHHMRDSHAMAQHGKFTVEEKWQFDRVTWARW